MYATLNRKGSSSVLLFIDIEKTYLDAAELPLAFVPRDYSWRPGARRLARHLVTSVRN